MSIENIVKKKGFECKFDEFSLDIDIIKHYEDPLRSWTERMSDGKRMIVNGVQLVHHFYLCTILKKGEKNEIL